MMEAAHSFRRKHWILISAAAACFCTAQAQAGQHFICYEGPAVNRGTDLVSKAVVGCYDDSAQPCSIRKIGSSAWGPDQDTSSATKVRSTGDFRYFEHVLATPPPLEVEVTFGTGANQIVHNCKVTVTSGFNSKRGSSEGVLTGFSSDASGLVSTGVWRVTYDRSGAQLHVPSDFVVSGGGFQSSADAFITRAYFGFGSPSNGNDPRLWLVSSATRSLTTPRTTTAYAVGLRIHGLSAADLINWVGLQQSSSAMQPQTVPSVNDFAAPGRVILGGGFLSYAAPYLNSGLFASATAPGDYTRIRLQCSWFARLLGFCRPPSEQQGWYAQSRSVSGNLTGSISLQVQSMLGKIRVNGKDYLIRGRYLTNASSPGYQSTAVVQGMRGDYAVTSAGAATLCQGFRNLNVPFPCASNDLLTEVVPMLDEGGAKASATHMTGMGNPSTGSVTAYVNGIKLEPIVAP